MNDLAEDWKDLKPLPDPRFHWVGLLLQGTWKEPEAEDYCRTQVASHWDADERKIKFEPQSDWGEIDRVFIARSKWDWDPIQDPLKMKVHLAGKWAGFHIIIKKVVQPAFHIQYGTSSTSNIGISFPQDGITGTSTLPINYSISRNIAI